MRKLYRIPPKMRKKTAPRNLFPHLHNGYVTKGDKTNS